MWVQISRTWSLNFLKSPEECSIRCMKVMNSVITMWRQLVWKDTLLLFSNKGNKFPHFEHKVNVVSNDPTSPLMGLRHTNKRVVSTTHLGQGFLRSRYFFVYIVTWVSKVFPRVHLLGKLTHVICADFVILNFVIARKQISKYKILDKHSFYPLVQINFVLT